MYDVVMLGETMIRLAAPDFRHLEQVTWQDVIVLVETVNAAREG